MKIWKAFATGLWLYCWLAVSSGFMDLTYFEKEIRPICYDGDEGVQDSEYPHGQKLPIPNSLEAFISLVEKIENLPQKYRLMDVVKILLVSFRYDDLSYTRSVDGGVFSSRSKDASAAFNILKILFDKPASSSTRLSNDALTQDEKCALYFMISHTVNGTIRKDDETITMGDGNNKVEVLKHPREQGVVSLNSDTKHAFALGKVLLGLFAGLANKVVDSTSIYNILISTETEEPESLKGDSIDGLYAATFGDLISISKEKMMTSSPGQNLQIFLPNGEWDDETCPIDYELIGDEYENLNYLLHTTYSSIRGAMDGYILGRNVRQMMEKNSNIRLSQILRAYYSIAGLSVADDTLSWCFRHSQRSIIFDELKRFAEPYDKLYSAVNGRIGTSVTEGIRNVFDEIVKFEGQIFTEPSSERSSGCEGGSYVNPECETPSDIFAIMDYKTAEDRREAQREIIGQLTSGKQMSLYGSSVSVYTNLNPFGAVKLDSIINGSTYAGCASCAIKYTTQRTGGSKSEAQVFRDLNHELEVVSQEQEESPGVPSKVILYFNYGTPSTKDRNIRDAVYDFGRDHRDTKVLAFGSNKESLKLFVDNPDKDIETTPILNELFHRKIADKVCRTIPAIFQYKNCADRTDSNEMANKYEGFITPNSVQYWAMYPKYFLKSYRIKLRFRALQGALKVCFSRHYSEIFDIKDPKADCRDTNAAQTTGDPNTIEFTVSNPCHKYTWYNCRPFYLYIEGKHTSKLSNDNSYCADQRCKTPDQFPFEFTHEGISCNKGSFLACTTSTVFYATLSAIFWFLFAAKER